MEENREKSIVNKVVVVTGGSRGIGAQIVKTLANENYKVILNYNNSKEQAEKIQQELLEQGKEIEIIKADVSKREETEKLIQFAINKFNKIDVFYCNQQALKYMIQEQQGCIINISSIWGETGASCEVAYSTTKAAINGMTKALAKEVGPSNIRVNAIAPGIIDTDMNRNLTNEELEQIKEQIPLNKIGKALDIAKCVKWLIEDEYTTGQIISINGGWYI